MPPQPHFMMLYRHVHRCRIFLVVNNLIFFFFGGEGDTELKRGKKWVECGGRIIGIILKLENAIMAMKTVSLAVLDSF